MKLRNTAVFLTLCLCSALLCGCGKDGDSAARDTAMQITIESKELSMETLQAQDYTVELYVTLDKNSGVTYSEWGISFDERLTVTANSKGLPFNTVSSVNDEKHFLWTAWASASVDDTTGELLQLVVTLPEDARAGDSYAFTYADVSAADKPHVWQGDKNWVEENEVSWTNGVITLTE